MDLMSGRTTVTLLIFVGAAALGMFIESRKARNARAGIMLEPNSDPDRVRIDDDAAAEIIKRAKPQFERARELYAY
jgi:hypothetical protein